MVDVRPAQVQDLQKLVLLGPHFADQMPYKNAGCHAGSVLRMLRLSLSQNLLIAAMHGEQAVGCLLGIRMPLWFDPETLIAVELAWWLEPEYRTGTGGIRMLSFFEAAARDAGCHYASMMLMENIQPERVATLYEHRDYRLTERVFLKELICLE